MHGVLCKSIVTSKSIKANEKFKFENLKTVVTKDKKGILPNKYFEIVNKEAKRDLPENHILKFEDMN